MKKWLAFLLFLIAVAGIVVPCCQVDDCCADQSVTTANGEDHETEGTCSPFFACATCPGFVELTKPIQLAQPNVAKQVHYSKSTAFNPYYHAQTCWQPPRFC